MSMEGEGYKLRSWVDAFLRIPFGKCVPLPVTIADDPLICVAIGTGRALEDPMFRAVLQSG